MMLRDSCPSDHELLMAADGELGARRAKRVAAHRARCWRCRARTGEMEAAIAEFVREHREGGPRTAAEGPRALLRARLRGLAGSAEAFGRRRTFAAGLVLSSAAAVILALGLFAIAGRSRVREARLLPLSRVTPGVAATLSRGDVCVAAPPKNRAVPAVLRSRVFQEYGISDPDPSRYEVDYLITPALGGADDIRNLWPQPYAARVWNAAAKDALEDRLHAMVCEGKMDLPTAQHEISGNWIAAYRKYVGGRSR